MPGKKPIKRRFKLKRAKKEGNEQNLVYHVYLPYKFNEKTGEPISYRRTGKLLLSRGIIQKLLVDYVPGSAKEAGLKWGDKCFEVAMYPYEKLYGKDPPKIGLGHDIYKELEKIIRKDHPDIKGVVMMTNIEKAERIPKNMGFTHVHEMDRLNNLGFKYYVKKLGKE